MTSFYIIVFLTIVCCTNGRRVEYRAPAPLLEALQPRGLRVSIPHDRGVQLFAFHGNINEQMYGLEAGELSKEVTRKRGDRWVIEFPDEELKPGDKIYFWAYVLHHNLGFRRDNGFYEVKTLVPSTDGVQSDIPITPSTCAPPPIVEPKTDMCSSLLFNLTQTVLDLNQEVDSLEETNNILMDLLKKHHNASTTLILDGPQVPDNDLAQFVLDIIREKLKLDVKLKHDSITRKKNGTVKFQVANLADKIQVIKAAKKLLKNSRFTINY